MNEPMPKRAERRDPPEARVPNTLHHAAPLRGEARRLRRRAACRARARRSRAPTSSVRTPRPTKTSRHVVDAQQRARAAPSRISAPRPPATIIQPASDDCRSGGYHIAIAFSGAIRHTHTPAPITARATTRPSGDCARPKAMRAHRGHAEQHRLDAARSVAIEQHPGRNLHQRERQEVGAGQQAERRRRQRELARQVGRDHRIDRPEHVRQQIAGGEDDVDRAERQSQPSATSAAEDEIDGAHQAEPAHR